MRVDRKLGRAPRSAGIDLSELELILGEVSAAIRDGETAVDHADKSGETVWSMASRGGRHGNALHQLGRRAEAEERFVAAEAMMAEHWPESPLLYSLQ